MLRTGDRQPDIDALLDAPGIKVAFTFRNEPLEGELLGFRNDSAFILVALRMYAVEPYALGLVRRAQVDWVQRRFDVDKLRRQARYPMGISTALETTLLAKLNQAETQR